MSTTPHVNVMRTDSSPAAPCPVSPAGSFTWPDFGRDQHGLENQTSWTNESGIIGLDLYRNTAAEGDAWTALLAASGSPSPFPCSIPSSNGPFIPDVWSFPGSVECADSTFRAPVVAPYTEDLLSPDVAAYYAPAGMTAGTQFGACDQTSATDSYLADYVGLAQFAHQEDRCLRCKDHRLLYDARVRSLWTHEHGALANPDGHGSCAPDTGDKVAQGLSSCVQQFHDATSRTYQSHDVLAMAMGENTGGSMSEAQRRLGCLSPSLPRPAQMTVTGQPSYLSPDGAQSYVPLPVQVGIAPFRKVESVDQYRAQLYSMYGVDKQIDGMYHCPFKAATLCEHEPSRSRSDCEQYIDSHVKPYRCAFTSCEDLKFSSLACRLRHEKEAHGAHGHGVRPFHCLYPECERSLPGHGFPRHWNRNDHMKRVHNHPETKRRKTGDANYVDPSTLEYISLGPDSNGVVDDGRFRPPAKRRRKA